MPTYQYRCLDCKRRFDVFMRYDEYGTRTVKCSHCQSENVQRRIGRIRIARSEDSRLDEVADPGDLEGIEDDPRALGRMMRKMSREMDEDMGPEFDEVINRLEAGQSPEEIEEAVPGLGERGEGGAGFGDGDDF